MRVAVRAAAAFAAAVTVAQAAGALGATAGTPAAPLRLRDDRGIEQRFAAPPARIVSLVPSVTESVCVLGGCARLVGVDRFSNWPAEVAALPRLGGLDDALVERIVALRPDVVLAAPSARVVERLASLGVPVLAFESQTHEDVRRSLHTLAQLLGRPAEGERQWAAIEAELAAAAARVPAALRGQRVYFEADGTPYAAGEASFIGQTLASLGLRNIVPAAMGPFPRLSPEFVLRSRPDLVLAPQRELETMAARPGWQQLIALRGRSCGFSPAEHELLVRPGPRLGTAAARLADCFSRLAGAS